LRVAPAWGYQKACLLIAFFFHFALLLTVAVGDILWLIGKGLTSLPASFAEPSKKTGVAVAGILGRNLPSSNPFHQGIATYLAMAGIQTGYGYFAPNVPKSFSVIFELQFPDGHVEYDFPPAYSHAADLRITGMVDDMVNTPYEALREWMMKTLASSVWQRHPTAKKMRAMLGAINFPGPIDFMRGKKATYDFLYTYEFSLSPTDANE
jgi:hypothetical protein